MEKIFKVGILVLFAVFLFIFYSNSQNKRFEYHERSNAISNAIVVFDNRTGIFYGMASTDKGEPRSGVFNLISSTREIREIKLIPRN
jgi:hypothetical protein